MTGSNQNVNDLNGPHLTDRLSAYLDGEMSPAERGLVEAHLRRCPLCENELATLRATATMLRDLKPLPTPRSFALRPAMVAASPRRPFFAGLGSLNAAYGNLKAATAFATLLLIFTLGLDFTLNNLDRGNFTQAMAPAFAAAPKPDLDGRGQNGDSASGARDSTLTQEGSGARGARSGESAKQAPFASAASSTTLPEVAATYTPLRVAAAASNVTPIDPASSPVAGSSAPAVTNDSSESVASPNSVPTVSPDRPPDPVLSNAPAGTTTDTYSSAMTTSSYYNSPTSRPSPAYAPSVGSTTPRSGDGVGRGQSSTVTTFTLGQASQPPTTVAIAPRDTLPQNNTVGTTAYQPTSVAGGSFNWLRAFEGLLIAALLLLAAATIYARRQA